MSQGDQFHQYGYDHYLKAPGKTGVAYRQSSYERDRKGIFLSLLYALASRIFLRNSLAAGGVVLILLLLFTGVWAVTSFLSDDGRSDDVVVVKAGIADIKYVPDDPGGMDVPYRQSTILARKDQPSAETLGRNVENLLENREREDLISKEEAFDRATQSSPMIGDDVVKSSESRDYLSALHAQAEGVIDVVSEQENAIYSGDFSVKRSFDSKRSAGDILQKIGSSKEDAGRPDDRYSEAFIGKTAKAAVVKKPAAPVNVNPSSLLSAPVKTVNLEKNVSKPDPSSLHGAGQSPETIEYVRSVLERTSYDTGGVQVNGADVQSIEPAVGVADNANTNDVASVPAVAPVLEGGAAYFVQLASIKDAKRAPVEWAKMQDKYMVLSSSRFRVQEALLPGGTFYRIQAGPMSKNNAKQVCDSLKQAGKPGGCLVVR